MMKEVRPNHRRWAPPLDRLWLVRLVPQWIKSPMESVSAVRKADMSPCIVYHFEEDLPSCLAWCAKGLHTQCVGTVDQCQVDLAARKHLVPFHGASEGPLFASSQRVERM